MKGGSARLRIQQALRDAPEYSLLLVRRRKPLLDPNCPPIEVVLGVSLDLQIRALHNEPVDLGIVSHGGQQLRVVILTIPRHVDRPAKDGKALLSGGLYRDARSFEKGRASGTRKTYHHRVAEYWLPSILKRLTRLIGPSATSMLPRARAHPGFCTFSMGTSRSDMDTGRPNDCKAAARLSRVLSLNRSLMTAF